MNRMKRPALAVSTLLSLTALAACSGGDSDDAKPASSSSASSAQAKQVTPAERLAKMLITKSEVAGYDLNKPSTEYAFAKSADEVTADKAACVPLALAMNNLPLGDPQADVQRVAIKGYQDAFTYVMLTAYESTAKAESAVAGLTKGVAACGGGFTAKAGANSSTYETVTAEKAASAGDESLAFKSTMTFRGVTHTLHTQAVRSGDVVAVYFGVNGTAIANSRPSDGKLATVVVKAQNARLG